jgi:hypothetical protein
MAVERRGKRSVGAQESKLERFERLAQRRVTEALRLLRLIGNLSNRQNYEYSEDHMRQIVDALDVEMRHLKQRFRQEETESGRIFSFKK